MAEGMMSGPGRKPRLCCAWGESGAGVCYTG
nr:MAG TPA: hypothetical protein [Caudoviricetes sp.]DAW45238.1 MAG TPA: hypothetical protein [Caudoviricetes sp.]